MSDLICRSALIDAIYEEEFQTFVPLDEVSTVIDRAPAVDAEPVRHGRWIHTTKEDSDWGGTFHRYTCSACNWSMGDNPTGWGLFCPKCGAKMDGDKE